VGLGSASRHHFLAEPRPFSGHNAEYWLTVVAAPFALIILGFAWYSVRRELRYGMMAFMTLLLGAGAYL
jgi:hypothetical protein